ncbi:glyoxylate reductase [Trichonephila inaurata madagascariensis]|uniref:Glyoxylate reductase n=1 Tax=Trichonephila inaurata madagascariensis TaxID=2747483 RepID=A0A8X6MCD6_9ARAC|nr:glyoxylate reductase [Trichonephila inaurata madagascariensis]
MSKKRVFVTRSDFPKTGINLLQEKYELIFNPTSKTCEKDHLLQYIKGVDGLFCMSTDEINKDVLDAAGPQLKVIATLSLGFDHIDIEECKKRNIIVCNAVNPISVSCVAEFTIGLLLAVSRRIVEASGAIQRGEWVVPWYPDWYIGRGLTNATVGIVGMGRIGSGHLVTLSYVLAWARPTLILSLRCICEAIKIGVTNTPHVSTDSVAEFTVMLMLAVGRRLFDSAAAIKKGEWVHSWSPMWLCGQGLKNATVGIVGVGRIVSEKSTKYKTLRWSRKARSVDRCLKEQTNQSCWNRCDVSRTSAERPRAFNVPKSW